MSEKHTDIVERLRDAMVEIGYGDRLEAADEIEQLRAALEKLVQTSLIAYHESEAAIAAAKAWQDAIAAARAAMKGQ
jgi:hypothetical protein